MSKEKVISAHELIPQLTREEKVSLLSGDDMWHTAPVPRLGIPRIRASDGPNGVRGTSWIDPSPSSCFPCSLGMAASFDQELARRVGSSLGAECRARGVHLLLGPTVNITRHPAGGRCFESYGEDPFLSGTMALAWSEGVHSEKVMTSPKHFLCNEQEFNRRSTNSVVDQRTLHEIYLEPFRILCKGNPATVMTSYNRVNGTHASEHCQLIRDILRKDFGFKGMTISDWGGTYSCCDAIKAGLDLEMPGPSVYRGPLIERDILSGKLSLDEVDACVLRALDFVAQAQASGIPYEAAENTNETDDTRLLMRQAAAEAVVLLKNSSGILPFQVQPRSKIAVIGPNAKVACISGGGSASLAASYAVTPFDAMVTAASECQATVTYSIGCDNNKWTPLLSSLVSSTQGNLGMSTVEFYSENPWESDAPICHFKKDIAGTYGFFTDGIPNTFPTRGYVKMTSFLTPNRTGDWIIGLAVAGQGDLYVDGKLLVENSSNQKIDTHFFNTGSEERTGEIHLIEGQQYMLEVRFSNFKELSANSPYSGRRGGIRIGGRPKYNVQAEIAKAVEVSQSCDKTIVFIGLNGEWESEAYDRANLDLPGYTNELVKAILAVNPDAVIVNQSGMPVELPWADQASTIVQSFYGGNEVGNGVADVLFGKHNPSSKLPFTWPKRMEDCPSHEGFGHPVDTVYKEGLYVGYRYFDQPGHPQSLFPFGHGLAYTTFEMSNLTGHWVSDLNLSLSFDVTNTGTLLGAAIGQVYVHAVASRIERVEMELAGFSKTTLQPGEKSTVTLHIDHKAFSYYDVIQNCWMVDQGFYEVRLATSAIAITASITIFVSHDWSWVGNRDPVRR